MMDKDDRIKELTGLLEETLSAFEDMGSPYAPAVLEKKISQSLDSVLTKEELQERARKRRVDEELDRLETFFHGLGYLIRREFKQCWLDGHMKARISETLRGHVVTTRQEFPLLVAVGCLCQAAMRYDHSDLTIVPIYCDRHADMLDVKPPGHPWKGL